MSVTLTLTTRQLTAFNAAMKLAKTKPKFKKEGRTISFDADGYRAINAIVQDAWFKENLAEGKHEGEMLRILNRLEFLSTNFPSVDDEGNNVPVTSVMDSE